MKEFMDFLSLISAKNCFEEERRKDIWYEVACVVLKELHCTCMTDLLVASFHSKSLCSLVLGVVNL